jgi:hypothetical protein
MKLLFVALRRMKKLRSHLPRQRGRSATRKSIHLLSLEQQQFDLVIMVLRSRVNSMPMVRMFRKERNTVTPAHGRVDASSKESQSGSLTSEISIRKLQAEGQLIPGKVRYS